MSHQQTVLTFICPVDPHAVDDLTRLLAEVADDLAGNRYVRFPELTSLHFASFVILPDDTLGPYLVFENNFDGPLDAYIDALLSVAADGLHTIYQQCLGYPRHGPLDRAQLARYLRDHVVWPSAYHVGNPGRSLQRIRQEAALRRSIESFVDDLVRRGSANDRPLPRAIRQRIQEFVRTTAAITSPPRQTTREFLIPRARLVAVAVAAMALLPLLAPLVILALARLRWLEVHDPVDTDPPAHDYVGTLLDNENRTHIVQNHMASITTVKPGLFRRLTLRLVLFVVNLAARTITNGELSGIPSIHFAHWSQIDHGRRLLFLSNFDGSWESYLDDFIDKAASGLTAIWGNTSGFPRTCFLIGGGARDGTRFKAIARRKQVVSNVWYSAYADLSVVGINTNSTIREDLFRDLQPEEERQWLWRL